MERPSETSHRHRIVTEPGAVRTGPAARTPAQTPGETPGEAQGRTPFLVFDVQAAVRAYERIRDALPGVGVHYAVKCQPDASVLAGLVKAGARFEVASAREIRALRRLGVPGSEMVFANPVKPITDIAYAWKQGVPTYAFDSPAELVKLRTAAPGAEVMVRLATAPGSEVRSEGKFGVDPISAATLLLAAAEQGFDAAGIGFHVGSQTLDPGAWVAPIEDAAHVMRAVERHGLKVRLIDVGGGFPVQYGDVPVPPIERYGQTIRDALEAHLPHGADGVDVIAEPGRAIAAAAGTMVSTVIGVARRGGAFWAHLDAGAFHGLPEALETGCGIPYPVSDSRGDRELREYTLTGPSCDSQDTIRHGVPLSAGLVTGDRVMLGATGAYSTGYGCSGFNGFAGPKLVAVNTTGGDGDA